MRKQYPKRPSTHTPTGVVLVVAHMIVWVFIAAALGLVGCSLYAIVTELQKNPIPAEGWVWSGAVVGAIAVAAIAVAVLLFRWAVTVINRPKK